MTTAWQGLGRWLAGRAKLALIVPLTLAIAATAADTVPQVILATPGSSGTGEGTVTRFTLRFSEDMVALGDPRAAAPATNDCKRPSTARWVDTRTWVLEFDAPLPGGLRCHVELRSGLVTARAEGPAAGSRRSRSSSSPPMSPPTAPRSPATAIARLTASARRSRSTCCRARPRPRS